MNLLDDELQPHADQWRYLSSISRMPPAEVGDLTEEAGRRGRVLGVRLPAVEDEDEAPWLAPPSRRKPDTSITDPLPETVEVVLGDQVYVDRSGLPASLVNQLARLAAGPTPWCWCIDGNSSTSGSRGWAASSIFVPMRSVGSVEASARRPVSSTSPSYRVSSRGRRVSPRVGGQLRGGGAPLQGSVRPRLVRDGDPQGRASPDHLHAMRAGSVPRRRPSAGGQAPVQPSGDAPRYPLRPAGGAGPRSTAHPTGLWRACPRMTSATI